MTNTPASELLSWYDQYARALPWRALPGVYADPYHVWLSEIMLQQTNVTTVKPYFEKFLRLFPQIEDLAVAEDTQVMAAWAGLGYYSRARNLLKCARQVHTEYQGRFPDTQDALLALPGIGPYTAAAIAAIAFNRPTAPVDGNIERVLSRLYLDTTPLPALKKPVKTYMQNLVPDNRPGDFAQAMMDLGATICTPKRPDCSRCPWQGDCLAHQQGVAETLPRRAPKKPKPERSGTVFWLENQVGDVLMARRPDKGLLGGMMMFPSLGWDPHNETSLSQSLPENWTKLAGNVVHIFTHFRLTLQVQAQTAPKGFRIPAGYQWVSPRDFATQALPSVMRKIVVHVLDG
jgi:A/G-specific adenine glycosylase